MTPGRRHRQQINEPRDEVAPIQPSVLQKQGPGITCLMDPKILNNVFSIASTYEVSPSRYGGHTDLYFWSWRTSEF
ncbi:hypothetical protein J6590_011896 [Homalodisca vitripennis]|nr:hypothetical protein J6590_011896 [Homalodisca vitripennis]